MRVSTAAWEDPGQFKANAGYSWAETYRQPYGHDLGVYEQ
jgi:hypothetical protein